MARQTSTLEAGWYEETTSQIAWTASISDGRPQINAALTDSVDRYFARLILSVTGACEFSFDESPTNLDSTGRDLSDTFEAGGSFTVTAGGFSITVELAGMDTSDPYGFTPTNSAEVTAFFNNVSALPTGNGEQAGTLTLDDGASAIYVGSTQIRPAYVGSTSLAAAYVGSTKVF